MAVLSFVNNLVFHCCYLLVCISHVATLLVSVSNSLSTVTANMIGNSEKPNSPDVLGRYKYICLNTPLLQKGALINPLTPRGSPLTSKIVWR